MFRFKKLLGNFFGPIRSLSKKAYTSGLIIVSACIITVLIIGTGGFIDRKSSQVKHEDIKEEEQTIQNEEEIVLALDDEDQISTNIKNIEVFEEEEIPALMIHEEEQVFRTSSKPIAENSIQLLTEQDYMALVKIVEAEATGEDLKGKTLIANVVLNRVKSSGFPNTIYDVIHQKINGQAQFSPISDGRYYSVPITESSYEAVELALSGQDESKGALFFVARSLASDGAVSWFDENLKKVLQYGVHEFYTYY